MLLVGLTGSIGMGKSTVSGMLADLGVPVYDADATVHRLYAPGGAACKPVSEAFEGVLDSEGGIDRKALSTHVVGVGKEASMKKLEALVHPLVKRERDVFLEECSRQGDTVVVLDIPLLYETGAESEVDYVLVVSAPEDVQRERVLRRPGMTEEKFSGILARQVPDEQKRARAHFVVNTGCTLEETKAEVAATLDELRSMPKARKT